MAEFDFNLEGILSPEEAESFLHDEDDAVAPAAEEIDEQDEESNVTDGEGDEEPQNQEEVGAEENNEEPEEKAATRKGGGASPSVYSSIAKALKDDGIFPDFDDDEIAAVKTADDFAEFIDKAVDARFDEKQRRMNEAINNGVQPDTVSSYERTLEWLNGVEESSITDESEDGEKLRRYLIYNDFIKRGYSQDRANREVEKSFKSGSDIEDAQDALEGLKQAYSDEYRKIQDDAKAAMETAKKEQNEMSERFRKMVLEDEVAFGDMKLDKRTRQKVFDSVSKPVYKDPKTGRLYTAIQKFQMDNPLEYLKQMGLWFTLTDGGKNINALVKDQVRQAKNKSIKELERKINTSSFRNDGSLQYTGGVEEGDILLSDGWQVGFGDR